jgi:hypothetical protein
MLTGRLDASDVTSDITRAERPREVTCAGAASGRPYPRSPGPKSRALATEAIACLTEAIACLCAAASIACWGGNPPLRCPPSFREKHSSPCSTMSRSGTAAKRRARIVRTYESTSCLSPCPAPGPSRLLLSPTPRQVLFPCTTLFSRRRFCCVHLPTESLAATAVDSS